MANSVSDFHRVICVGEVVGSKKGVVHIHTVTVDVRFSRLEPCAILMLLSGKKTAHGTLWTPTTTSTSRTLNVARAAVKGQEGESLETLRNIHYLLVKIIRRAFLACPPGVRSPVKPKLLPGPSFNICTLFAYPRPVKSISMAGVHCG